MSINDMELYFFKCFLIASKLVQEIPPHGIHVGLSNFLSELWMVFMQKSIEVFVSNEMLLLDNLSVNIW